MKAQNKAVNNYRETGLRIIYQVLEEGAYANIELNKSLRANTYSINERRTITELVNGTVRMVMHLDEVLNLFLKSPINRQNPWLRSILRLSAYQLLFMHKSAAYASVSEAVELGKKFCNHDLSRVINGVLRNIVRRKDSIELPQGNDSELSTYYSHPLWIIALLRKNYPKEIVEEILKFNNKAQLLCLRNNCLKCSREELIELLNAENIVAIPMPIHGQALQVLELATSIADSECFKQGLFYVQDPASILCASILDPKPGEVIYDLCCGVGGKTTHMAELMQNQGIIYAFDLYEQKIDLLSKNCARLGITNVKAYCQDLRHGLENIELGNKVLLDAPCSGLGVLSRRADSRWRISEERIADLISVQKQLLMKAAACLLPDGKLLYSTCTLNSSENEELITAFINDNREFCLEDFSHLLPAELRNHCQSLGSTPGMMQIYPGQFGTNGMFFALLRRKPTN